MAERAVREPAIDLVRGFVMILMTLDHVSGALNGGRSMADSAASFRLDTVFDPLQFLARWVTHLCAPTFSMLAGVSLALSATRRLRDGVDAAQIDRDILIRGALLVVLDIAWTSWMWRLGKPIQVGVLYAIGMSMIGLIALRRVPPLVVGAIGVAFFVAGDAIIPRIDPSTPLAWFTVTGGGSERLVVLYPFLPWTGFLLIGWAIGARIAAGKMMVRDWFVLSAACLATFAIVRGLNGYGNAGLLRRDGALNGAWIEWLHVSKYPPCLAFAGLELGLSFALLGAGWAWSRTWPIAATPSVARPVIVLGQTALFYFLIHAHIAKGVALALGIYKSLGLGATVVGWVALLVVLYPACRWYLGVKRRHPNSVLRFV